MKHIKAHMIRHAHWDREWYLSFEEFRAKLVRLVDELLDEVDNNENAPYFMLDGQSIVLEDYLEIRPDKAGLLMRAVRNGRIGIGPWYVLPDELLISGESHIRNYLIGGKLCSVFGEKNNVAYLPDSFGHPAQMPQIIRGLGMDVMLFWRGTAGFMEKTEFFWEAPAKGISVLCVHMPHGYGNSGRLSGRMDETLPRLDAMVDSLSEKSTTDTVVLMNGSDHILGQRESAGIVERYNALTERPYRIVMSDMASFLSELRPKLSGLATYSGALCYGDRALLLGGTLSTRMPLKQLHTSAERRMERYLEPMAAFVALVKADYDFAGYGEYIWKSILKNAPHDSICGCSVDEVHRAMTARYEQIGQAQRTQMNGLCSALCVKAEPSGDSVTFLVFEPSQDALPTCIELIADFDPMLIRRVNFAKSAIDEFDGPHPPLVEGVEAFGETGERLESALLSSEKAEYMHLLDETMPEVYRVNRAKALVRLGGMAPGFHRLTLKKCSAKKEAYASGQGIENEFYSIRAENGSFTILVKKCGREHKGVLTLTDTGDAGDEYTYSWPMEDAAFTLGANGTAKAMRAGPRQSLVYSAGLCVPEALAEDRSRRSERLVSCPVTVTASLYDGIDRIDFTVELENNAKDHRIQVSFPVGALCKKSEAYATFALEEHPIEIEIPETWEEYPRRQHVCHGYASVSDGRYGITGAARGITEYEAKNENGQSFLLFTLLRCVGYLSRSDLLSRKGNGGWTLETPEAQCLGRHVFELSIAYHEGDLIASSAYRMAERFLLEPIAYPLFRQEYRHENRLAFLAQFPSAARVSAVKCSEDGEALIVRFVNISKERLCFSFLPGEASVEYVNLAEKDPRPVGRDARGAYELAAAAAEIVTLRLGTQHED